MTPAEISGFLERTLLRVQKPARYTGGEWNSVVKDWDTTPQRVALAFPDIYDLGMSNLGLAILYDQINQRPEMLAERIYAPWTDMEAELRAAGVPLHSLETRHALADFDIVGFSLPYEQLYTNVLNMLDLAGLPLRAEQRSAEHPLILAGGPSSRAVDRLLKEPASAAAVHALGPIPDAELPALYRGAALFVFPSHYEGFGLPVLEAMASATPVLCSTAAALLELTGGAAEHVGPEDDAGWRRTLQELLENPARRESLAASGRARAAAFNPERMASSILAVLDEVAAWRR